MALRYYYLPFLLIFTLVIPLAHAYEDTKIEVSIVGESIINLDSSNRLIRAYIDVTNFDPSEGSYLMKIIQSSTGFTISEQEVLVREKGNDKAGVNVAYLVNDDDLNFNGSKIHGNYDILIQPEFGNSLGSATFLITNSQESSFYSFNQDDESLENSDENLEPVSLTDSMNSSETNSDIPDDNQELLYLESSEVSEKKIPEWIRSIFILYADGSISEYELLNAIKFLIEQEILLI